MRTVVVVACVAALAASCPLKDDLTPFGTECEADRDCGRGYVCDPVQTICVEEGADQVDEGAVVAAFCGKLAECDGPEAGCAAGHQAVLDAAAGQGSDVCRRMHDAELDLLHCRSALTCNDFDGGGGCADELAAVFAVGDDGGNACRVGDAPFDVPGWACPGHYLGDGDCDCGCGGQDPDCNGQGCVEPSCNDDAHCDFCYDAAGQAQGRANDACSRG